MIKGSIHQEDATILMCMNPVSELQNMKHKLRKPKTILYVEILEVYKKLVELKKLSLESS